MSITVFVAGFDDDYVNVTNTNFLRLLELLGVDDPGPAGEFSGPALDELSARITFALESLAALPELDGGTATREIPCASGPRWIEVGLREGYYVERLTALQRLISLARSHGRALSFS